MAKPAKTPATHLNLRVKLNDVSCELFAKFVEAASFVLIPRHGGLTSYSEMETVMLTPLS